MQASLSSKFIIQAYQSEKALIKTKGFISVIAPDTSTETFCDLVHLHATSDLQAPGYAKRTMIRTCNAPCPCDPMRMTDPMHMMNRSGNVGQYYITIHSYVL